MSKILLIGGNGYIGSKLQEVLEVDVVDKIRQVQVIEKIRQVPIERLFSR